MSWPLARLLSLASAVETAIFVGVNSNPRGRCRPDLRKGRDLLRFRRVCLVTATSTLLAVVIWNSAHEF